MHHCQSRKPRARAPACSGWAALITAATCLAILTSCGEPFYCTPGAATWQVTVLDADGAPVPDLRWTAVIELTHDTIPATLLAAHSDPAHGTYAVFTDAVRDRIDPTGEVVRVEGASGSEWFSAAFTFAVPQADCYANRVSGPDTVTLAPAAFALVNADRVWGGGDIFLVSPVLRLVDSLPFLVDGDTAWSHAIAGDTAAVTAPLRTGTYGVEAVRGAEAESLGSATVRGYGGLADGPPLTGIVMRWPPNTPRPTFLANGPDQLQLFDAATRSVVTSFPDSIHHPAGGGNYDTCPPGIGPTYDPYAVVLCPEPSTLQAWDLEADPVPIDVPRTGGSDVRMAALASPGRWLVGYHHYLEVFDGLDHLYLWIDDPEVIQISSQGNRVVVVGWGQPDGVVVFDTAGLAPAYYIEELAGSSVLVGAGFSGDGRTLYASAQVGDSIKVVAVAAEAGDMLAYTALPELALGGPLLLVDQRGKYVFLLGGSTPFDPREVFWVLDAASLDVVAEIELPATCQTYPPSNYPAGLVQDETENRVYAVWAWDYYQARPQDNSCIEWFDVW